MMKLKLGDYVVYKDFVIANKILSDANDEKSVSREPTNNNK